MEHAAAPTSPASPAALMPAGVAQRLLGPDADDGASLLSGPRFAQRFCAGAAAVDAAPVQDVTDRGERPVGELSQLAKGPAGGVLLDDARSTRACTCGSGRGLAVPANCVSGRSCGWGG